MTKTNDRHRTMKSKLRLLAILTALVFIGRLFQGACNAAA